MLPTNNAALNAFQLLTSTVRAFYEGGRPCLGATLKPELRRANFNEQILGFRRFGDFLRAAEAAGCVQLSPTPGGDIKVWPSDVTIPEQRRQVDAFMQSLAPTDGAWSAGPRSTTPIRVRQDLWNAFNSFSADWAYNPATDTAFKDTGPVGQANQDAQQLIPIPAGRDRVLQWMRAFTNMQDPETKANLRPVFEGDAPLYQFTNLVRLNAKAQRAWRRFHIQQVLAAIEAWAASNNVQPKNVTETLNWTVSSISPHVSSPGPLTAPIPSANPVSPKMEVSATSIAAPASLSGRLELLIDALIEDLIKLRGLLQIVGTKQQ